VWIGRLVRQDVAETVIVDQVKLNDCGIWTDLLAGKIKDHRFNNGQTTRTEGSAEPLGMELTIPSQAVLGPRPWPGDLTALRRACGAEDVSDVRSMTGGTDG